MRMAAMRVAAISVAAIFAALALPSCVGTHAALVDGGAGADTAGADAAGDAAESQDAVGGSDSPDADDTAQDAAQDAAQDPDLGEDPDVPPDTATAEDSGPGDAHVPDDQGSPPDTDAAPDSDATPDAQAPDATEDAGPTETLTCPEGMALIPEGPFLMGIDASNPEAGPQHTVTLSAYCMDVTETTVAAYQACVDDGACYDLASLALCQTSDPWRPASCQMGMEDHPANYVSWARAMAYCEWAGGDLPTEAQWEKGARGTDGRELPWGAQSASCDKAVWGLGPVYDDCAGAGPAWTLPADSLPAGASPYGLLHMAGNLDEWTRDWYDGLYYVSAPEIDPPGPTTGTFHVYRGGGFLSPDFELLTWFRRSGVGDTNATVTGGFRCVAEPIPLDP